MFPEVNIKEIILDRETIEKRIKELAEWINKEYANSEEVVLVGLLNGAIISYAQLVKDVRVKCFIDFMTVSSYQNMKSSNKVKIVSDIVSNIEGKDVLIFDEILDTGLTLDTIYKHLKLKDPKSLRLMVLLDKKDAKRIVDVKVDISGFSIPSDYVIGYGCDVNGYFRNWDYIASVKS